MVLIVVFCLINFVFFLVYFICVWVCLILVVCWIRVWVSLELICDKFDLFVLLFLDVCDLFWGIFECKEFKCEVNIVIDFVIDDEIFCNEFILVLFFVVLWFFKNCLYVCIVLLNFLKSLFICFFVFLIVEIFIFCFMYCDVK